LDLTSTSEEALVAVANDFNTRIIEEFRANRGRVGGPFQSVPILLLHTTGAKTGKERINPLAYQALGDSLAVFGSRGGSDIHPAWYHNLRANRKATVEVGSERLEVIARVAEGKEREEIWERQKQQLPAFADYERKTARRIPVIILEPLARGGPAPGGSASR
jgi:deazaflavin-dependent oxidoreductase (nitroreductase family)